MDMVFDSRISRRKFCKAALGALAAGFPPALVERAFAMPRNLKELRLIKDAMTETGLVHGDIPSLNSPAFLPMREAMMNMDPKDQCFVVPLPGGIRIYPQKILVWHEVVNEIIKGVPYCITYSPVSGSLVVYSSRVGTQNLILDAEGRIYNSNSILIDRNTGSLWSQLLGMAFDGPLAGHGMNILPSYWMTWKNAREIFKDAQVLATPRGGWRNYNRDPYGSYLLPGNYYDDERILYTMSHVDTRMDAKTHVIGLEVEKNLVAVDINFVREKKVVNFYSGIVPLVGIYDSRMDVARIFVRNVWEGRTPALFAWHENSIRDLQTRSLWSMDGRCVDGNLTGAAMDELFGVYAFWFVWGAFHPETELVPGPSVVPDSALVIGDVGDSPVP